MQENESSDVRAHLGDEPVDAQAVAKAGQSQVALPGEIVVRRRARRSPIPIVVAIALVLFAACYIYIRKAYPEMWADSKTYDIYWRTPSDWIKQPRSPFTLFLYKHPQHAVFIRGFQYHCDSDVSVSPNVDSAALADYYLTTTRENQPDWKGQKLEDVQCGDLTFSMIERDRKSGKVVYTAFATKGNTTLGASLYAGEKDEKYARETLPYFREFVKTIFVKPAKGRAGGVELPALAATVSEP